MTNYPIEILSEDYDDGTMVDSKKALEEAVIGHKIISVEGNVKSDDRYWGMDSTVLTLDNGTKVQMIEQGDCCAYTEVEKFLLNPECVDHIITGVGTTDEYQTWHIYADMGDVLELTVGWSGGNLGYYAFGFDIRVIPVEQ